MNSRLRLTISLSQSPTITPAWPSSARTPPPRKGPRTHGNLFAHRIFDQIQHQRPHLEGRRSGEDAEPGPPRHAVEPGGRQEAGRDRDCRRETPPEAARDRARKVEGVG